MTDEPALAPDTRARVGWGVAVLVILVFGGVGLWWSSAGSPGTLDHWKNRDRYDALRDAAIARAPDPGETLELRAVDLDPGRLHPAGSSDHTRGRGRGLVWVVVHDDGTQHVFIETIDLGHAGEYGYAWSSEGTPRWPADELGERWELSREIGDGWWTVAFKLG